MTRRHTGRFGRDESHGGISCPCSIPAGTSTSPSPWWHGPNVKLLCATENLRKRSPCQIFYKDLAGSQTTSLGKQSLCRAAWPRLASRKNPHGSVIPTPYRQRIASPPWPTCGEGRDYTSTTKSCFLRVEMVLADCRTSSPRSRAAAAGAPNKGVQLRNKLFKLKQPWTKPLGVFSFPAGPRPPPLLVMQE